MLSDYELKNSVIFFATDVVKNITEFLFILLSVKPKSVIRILNMLWSMAVLGLSHHSFSASFCFNSFFSEEDTIVGRG